MKLIAIPIMEFYDNAARYGPQFAGLPYVLGRLAGIGHSGIQADVQVLAARPPEGR